MILGIVPKGLICKYSGFLLSTPKANTLASAGTLPNRINEKTALDGYDRGLK
jgi:hypothetical protein